MVQKKKEAIIDANYLKEKKRINKKTFCFCHLPNRVKRSVVVFEAKRFWDKRKQRLTDCSCFYPKQHLFRFCCLCSYSKPHNVFVQQQDQNNLPFSQTFFFWQIRKQKNKKKLPICSQTNFLWFVFERNSKCWAAVVGKLFKETWEKVKLFVECFWAFANN